MHLRGLIIFLSSAFFSQAIYSATLNALHPQSPPDIFLNNETKTTSGPAKEIIEEAVGTFGYDIHWLNTKTFPTLTYKNSDLRFDLLAIPGVSETMGKELLPPMLYGFEDSTVYFIVHKGKAGELVEYDDLNKQTILTKKDHRYFSIFDTDQTLNKVSLKNYKRIVKRFSKKKNAVIATTDIATVQTYLDAKGAPEWELADYFYPQVVAHYYSIPKTSAHTGLHARINCALYEMRTNGRIADIYNAYKLDPPLQLFDHRDSISQKQQCESDRYGRSTLTNSTIN